jgi:hypothetical protein
MTNRSKWIAKIIEISHGLPNVCPDLRVAYGYAESGYDTPNSGIIVLANWSSHKYNSKDKADNTMPRLAKLLEYFGASLEWIDEWFVCNCGKCVRVLPNSYDWKSSSWISDGEVICRECVLENPDDYLGYLQGNERAALTLDIDLAAYGYMKHKAGCKTGFHYGQNDSPVEIAKSLRSMGVENFIFEIDEAQQFTVVWSVWIHKDELRRVKSYERKQRLAA